MILDKLGKHIELREIRNSDLTYGVDDVRGVNTSKAFMETRVDLTNRDLSKFQIVSPGDFVFNHRTSRNGSKLSIAYNDMNHDVICTEDYVVFRIKHSSEAIVLPEWIYMYFNRPEFDRYVITNSWGSSTEFFNWEDICDIDIELPPLSIQHKYVNIYKAMIINQRSYARGLEDLKLVCDAIIDRLKHSNHKSPIRKYVTQIDNRNSSCKTYVLKGLSMENYFIDSIADKNGLDFSKYKIVQPDEFGAVLMKVGRDARLTIAHNTSDENYLISPAYYTFKVEGINSNYFKVNVNRTEFERKGWFLCDSSARGSLSWDDFLNLTIPDANADEQKIISNLYEAQITRSEINDKLQNLIKSIYPILIKGSLEEGQSS